ncbi:MAG: hypothetical protein PHS57_05515 [Alphaproteobacteria bacterium]|nr:hypothetical protein [Alphaproteobacteria bacterium]
MDSETNLILSHWRVHDDREFWREHSCGKKDWLWPYDALATAELAHDLQEKYSTSDVYSLGYGITWPVKALEIERATLYNSSEKTGFIPFEGTLFNRSKRDGGTFVYSPLPNIDLNESKRKYTEFLEKFGLSSDTIIDRFEKDKVSTTIVNLSKGGEEAASFLFILLSAARENGNEDRLRKALNVHLITSRFATLETIFPSALKIDGFDPVPCCCEERKYSYLYVLWNNGFSADLVPDYPPAAWGKMPGSARGEKKILDYTEKKLREAVLIVNCAPERADEWVQAGEKSGPIIDEICVDARIPPTREQTTQKNKTIKGTKELHS